MGRLTIKLILGKTHIESKLELKRAMLIGYYALLSILNCVLYLVLDLNHGGDVAALIFMGIIAIMVITLVLNRTGKRALAKYLLLPSLVITVYLIASSESSATGAYLFYPVICLAAFALFGPTEKGKALIFTIITFGFFLSTVLLDFSILPFREYDDTSILFNFLLNACTALVTFIFIIQALLEINEYLERQILEQNELLNKANHELDRFVYSASHDLKAPLSSVLGLINITRNAKDRTEINHYLNLMEGRVHALEAFIKDITNYSRNNRLEINKSQVLLSEVIHEIWEGLRYNSEADGIELQLDFPTEHTIETDRARLKVVLGNLLANAIRYHDSSKSERFIRVGISQSNNEYQLHVEDNGQGIDPTLQEKVFEMYFRGNERSKGNGLGLYIVKKAVEKLN